VEYNKETNIVEVNMKESKINIRVSTDIKKQVEEKAAKLGMAVSEYIRYLILKDLEQK
jgi:predicted DNA binding CopG/RHH family protein